ncbi:hypothetical protein BGZ63DRAFT_440861 [Mariannaea sp. PMI_226]|nr:hypothetical protein BGZ63DRAFT_440861 [Mariannaea sp. PMI_226]
MKFHLILTALVMALLPLADATCKDYNMGWFQRKWRLATFKSKNCINKTGDWTHKGFGVWCVNIPNTTKSFIFNVGGGYNPVNLEGCTIFFNTKDNCGGSTITHHGGDWKKSSLSAKESKMKGAYIQCTRLFGAKRDVMDEYRKDRKFIRDENGEWYEEREDGSLIEVEVREAHELQLGDDQSISME